MFARDLPPHPQEQHAHSAKGVKPLNTKATPARSRRLAHRALGVLAAALCVALGAAAVPASAATTTSAATTGAHTAVAAADSTGLDQLTFQSAGNGRYLDDQNGTTGSGSIVVTNSAPGYDENWHIAAGADNSPFTIVNNATNECIDSGLPQRLQPCDGRSTEQWYLEPVANSAQHAFMIRQASGGNCLDVLLNAQYDDAWTDTYGCNGSAAQQWILPSAAYQAAWGLAVDYAAEQCESNTATCSWNATSQSPAAPLPISCVSPIWYNGTSAPVAWTFILNTTTGWADTLTTTLSTAFSGGQAGVLQVRVGTTLGNAVSMNLSQTLGNSLTIAVPVGYYGWVALSELATEVTGTWTFDAQGFAWTAQDTVTVPLTSDASGASSVYLARTSPTFTSCSA